MSEQKGFRKLCVFEKTNLPTNESAHYYGRADGNIYVIYASAHTTPTGRGKRKFVFAKVPGFTYDYESDKVYKKGKALRKNLEGVYQELDTPDTTANISVIQTKNVSKQLLPHMEREFFQHKDLPMIRTK